MMINKHHKMSTIVAEQLELNNLHQMEALCKLGSIMIAYNNQSECFSSPELTVKELKIMHENSLNLPSGCNTDEKLILSMQSHLQKSWLHLRGSFLSARK